MATLPANDLREEEEIVESGLTLAQILLGQNIAEMLDENELSSIGQRVIADVQIDEGSRGDWLERYQRSLDVAMQVKKAKNFPWPKAANVKYPLLTVAAIQFQARAYPVIVDGSNLVKGRVLGPDPDGTKRARADRIGQHMTWQLLYRMPGWEEDTDRLLLVLPIVGCMFRKSCYDSIETANRSETVSALDFIINYWAKSIETAPRYTHVLRYYPYEVHEKIAAGLWLDVPVDDTSTEDAGNDDQALGEYYEQHRCLDLDEDGYPEHYVVTCTKEGKVARIAPCFGLDTVTVKTDDGEMVKLDEMLESLGVQSGSFSEVAGLLPEFKIVKIERRQYFTKYSFIPAPDGSFYDIGFGALLDDISGTIDTTLNQLLDAGALQNAGGGFVGSGIQIRGGNMKFALGEWKRVDATGGPLRDNILPMPAPGPSAVLFNLLGLLIEAAKEITAVQDVMTGEGTANQPATTTLALIEQGQKVMTGIFKRIHRAFGQELRILRCLNRDYLDDEEYFQLNDADEAVQIGRADYEDRDLDVVPVSDPGQVSDMQKMARAQAQWDMFNGDPLINQRLLRENVLNALGAKDIPQYFEVPPPLPDPKIAAEADAKTAQAEQSRASASDTHMAAAEKALGLGLVEDAAALAAKAVGETDESADVPAGPGGIPALAGEPGDGGVPVVPPGPSGGPDAGVGPGSFPDGGAAGAGGPSGPVGGPEF
jgi:chaperonin GroES